MKTWKGRMMLKTLAGVALWAALCFGIWLLTLSSVSSEELAVGAVSSVACGVVAVAFGRALGMRWSLRAAPWAALPILLVAIMSDAVQVLIRPLFRDAESGVDEIDTGVRGDGAAAVTRRAAATLILSASPGTVVLDADERGRITFHSLGCAGPHVEEKVTPP